MTRRRQRYVTYTAIASLVILLFANGASGTLLFARAKGDPLKRADAIVVLAGEHDGREDYGIRLAEKGYAPAVLLSDPYAPQDKVMKSSCKPRPDIQVICGKPSILTTRGEALMARQLSDEHGWQSIIVVTWRYHLPRARKIFDECFASSTRHVTMRDVPRAYRLSVAQWQYTYLYQYGGWVKAEIVGCATAGEFSVTLRTT